MALKTSSRRKRASSEVRPLAVVDRSGLSTATALFAGESRDKKRLQC